MVVQGVSADQTTSTPRGQFANRCVFSEISSMPSTIQAQSQVGNQVSPEFTIFIDGACSLCAREAAFMAKLDAGRGRLAFVDIAAPNFDASRFNLTQEQAMGRIHGMTATGEIVEGVGVFRQAYAAVGKGWLLAWTAWPVLRNLADAGYLFFAWVRLRLPGRSGGTRLTCADGRCEVRLRPRQPLRAS